MILLLSHVLSWSYHYYVRWLSTVVGTDKSTVDSHVFPNNSITFEFDNKRIDNVVNTLVVYVLVIVIDLKTKPLDLILSFYF